MKRYVRRAGFFFYLFAASGCQPDVDPQTQLKQGYEQVRSGEAKIEEGQQLLNDGNQRIVDAQQRLTGGEVEDIELAANDVAAGNAMVDRAHLLIREGRLDLEIGAERVRTAQERLMVIGVHSELE